MRKNNWFDNWLLELDLHTSADALKAASSPLGRARLLELAATHDEEQPIASLPPNSVVAGRALDLSPFLACGHPDCQTRQINQLFGYVWHYFDKIAVVGPDAHALLEAVEEGRSPDRIALSVAAKAQVLLYIRENGLDDLLVFVDKPPACAVHWDEYDTLPALHLNPEVHSRFVDDMVERGKLRMETSKGKRGFRLHHPDVHGVGAWVALDRVMKNRRDDELIEHTVARIVVDRHALGAASDIYTSEAMSAPVGANLVLEQHILKELRPTVSADDVAFNLRLPVVTGVNFREVMAIRREEAEAFETFRLALKSAMHDRIAASSSPDAAAIARDVEEYLVAPALAEIEQRLVAAEDLLRRKHHINIGVAGFATICGLLGPPGVATATAMAAGVGAVNAELKRIEETRDVSLHNMYFLWKARQHFEPAKPGRQRPPRKKRRR